MRRRSLQTPLMEEMRSVRFFIFVVGIVYISFLQFDSFFSDGGVTFYVKCCETFAAVGA